MVVTRTDLGGVKQYTQQAYSVITEHEEDQAVLSAEAVAIQKGSWEEDLGLKGVPLSSSPM